MLDILAVGDAIVDKVIAFDETDKVMQKILPVKGLFFEATPEEHSYLRTKTALADYAGGSAANTIRSMALLGAKPVSSVWLDKTKTAHFLNAACLIMEWYRTYIKPIKNQRDAVL